MFIINFNRMQYLAITYKVHLYENILYFTNSFLYINFYFLYLQPIMTDNKLTQEMKGNSVIVAMMAEHSNLQIKQFVKVDRFFVF